MKSSGSRPTSSLRSAAAARPGAAFPGLDAWLDRAGASGRLSGRLFVATVLLIFSVKTVLLLLMLRDAGVVSSETTNDRLLRFFPLMIGAWLTAPVAIIAAALLAWRRRDRTGFDASGRCVRCGEPVRREASADEAPPGEKSEASSAPRRPNARRTPAPPAAPTCAFLLRASRPTSGCVVPARPSSSAS